MRKIHKTLLLKITEANEGKKRKLENTINLYAEVLKFYLEVIPKLGMYRIASMTNKEALTFVEFHTVLTKAHPDPPYPIFSGVQTNIRRSAINKAVGMVKSLNTTSPLTPILRAFPLPTTPRTLSLKMF